jgi:hypothetical protein
MKIFDSATDESRNGEMLKQNETVNFKIIQSRDLNT